MPRFLSEHQIDPAGTRLTLSKHAMFKRVFKVSNYFVLVVEVMDSESSVEQTIDIVVKRQNEYINPKSKYIDAVAVGTQIFHFFAQPIDMEDEELMVPEESQVVQQDPPPPPIKEEDNPAAMKKIRGW